MLFYLPKFKKDHLKSLLEEVLRDSLNKEPLAARLIAKVIGKLAAAGRALGSVIRIMLRSSHAQLDAAVLQWGWDCKIIIQCNVVEDLTFFLANLDQENDQPVRNHKTGVSLNQILDEHSSNMDYEMPIYRPVSSHEKLGGVVTSDAFDFMGYVFGC